MEVADYIAAVNATSPFLYWPIVNQDYYDTSINDSSGNSRNSSTFTNGLSTSMFLGAEHDTTYQRRGTNKYYVASGNSGATWTGTIPLLSNGLSVMCTVKMPTYTNYGPTVSLGGWSQFLFHMSSVSTIYAGTNASSRFTQNVYTTANRWMQFLFTQETSGLSYLYINGSQVATSTLTRPTLDGSVFQLFSQTGVSEFQHAAVWTKVLDSTEREAVTQQIYTDPNGLAVFHPIEFPEFEVSPTRVSLGGDGGVQPRTKGQLWPRGDW